MSKTIQELIDSLSHEEFQDLVDSLPEDELEHWGVLGMRWGVRKNRGTGKREGKPVKGTEAAKHDTPSVSPNAPRKTASPGGETSIPVNDKGSRISVKLDQKQKSKLGEGKLTSEDLSLEQLKSVADRMRIEKEIINTLEGPTREQAMQAVVNRIKLEQEYARLTAAPPSKKQVVIKKLGAILASVAETQTKNLLNAAAKTQVDKFLVQNGLQPTKDEKKKEDKAPDAPKAEDTPKAKDTPKAWEAPKSWKPPKIKDRRPN